MGFLLMFTIAVCISALILELSRRGFPVFASGDWPERGRAIPGPWFRYLAAVGAVILLLFLSAEAGPRDEWIFLFPALIIIALVLLSIWKRDFVTLMSLRDEDFPGRHDKLIWAFLLIAMPPVGVLFFRSYRLAHQSKPKPERIGGQAISDLF